MAEPKAFSIFFSLALILVGVPLLLFGILEYSSDINIGTGILGISIFMLMLGVIFLVVVLSQKST
jgi:hypothetical protein